jgi:hypothetical protein
MTQTFYYSAAEKTLYIYNAELLSGKIFDVLRVDRQDNSSMYFVYSLRGEPMAVIYGTQIASKI